MSTTNTAPAPTRPISRLATAKKGRLRAPLRFFFYGDNGVGKSTLAAGAPDPIWLDVEDGSARLDVVRYPFSTGDDGHVPRTYQDVLAAIDDLTTNPHAHRTLVIDTADALEKLIWQFLIDRESQPSARNKDGALTSIESFGYGRGYVMAVDEWRALCVRLDRLRLTRNMSIVMIAHSQVRTFKNPMGPDYDRYQPALHEKAAGFLKGWSDLTGRVCHEDDAAKTPGDRTGRPKGFSTGRRMLMLSHSAAFDAKSRIDLPDEVEIDIENPWAPLAAAVEAGYESETAGLAAAIAVELERIGDDEVTTKATAATDAAVAANDTGALQRFLHSLQKRPTKEVQS